MNTIFLPKFTVAEFITLKIAEAGKSQKEIANELGYEHANVISMIKSGATKLPLEKVGSMAAALFVDPIQLLRLTLDEYQPGLYAAIEDCLANPLLTRNERELIDAVRRVSGDADPTVFVMEESKRMVGVVLV
ncbi:MAG: helix-turn-helix transcriptional regulator [Formivibrio sp.]|nr:helix-turn-helix transcriptional regulator [Formivibrio sp.]